MRQTTRLLALAATCVAITGCAIPHSNTLVFAVNRKIGVDITPTNATSAGITIGYSSNEFAWVPLWANGPDGKPMAECNGTNTSNCSKHPKFIGKDAEGKGNGKDEDAYSVFASFGGSAAGSAATGNTAELKVASFFATGIAAQSLAQADPERLVGADIRGNNSNRTSALRKSLNAYFEATATKEGVTQACVDALKLDSKKFPGIGNDVNKLRSDLAADFVTKAVTEKAPEQSQNVKYNADLLRLKFEDEKAKAAAGTNAEDVARTAMCK